MFCWKFLLFLMDAVPGCFVLGVEVFFEVGQGGFMGLCIASMSMVAASCD